MSARQPLHTVYGGAHLFKADTARRLGERALSALEEHGAPAEFGAAFGLDVDAALARTIRDRVAAKLRREPGDSPLGRGDMSVVNR